MGRTTHPTILVLHLEKKIEPKTSVLEKLAKKEKINNKIFKNCKDFIDHSKRVKTRCWLVIYYF